MSRIPDGTRALAQQVAELLGDRQLATADSVFTERAAREMAARVASLLDVDVAVATTGVAGGESQDGTPPGTVYIATSVDGYVAVEAHRFDGSPEEVCDRATDGALEALVEALSTTD